MLKKGLAVLSVVLLLGGCSNDATAEDTSETVIDALADGMLTVGMDDTFAPMGFRDENNEIVGFDMDLANAVGEKLGVEVEFQAIDWTMKESELNAGNIDCIWNGYSITDDRKEQVAFSDPYLENRQLIIVLSNSEINTKEDLAGKVVAVQKDSSALEAVSADQEFMAELDGGAPVEFDTNIDCFMDLEAGRSDAIVCDEVLARYVMKQRGAEQYRVLDDNFGEEEYGIGFRMNDTDTVDKVNAAMDELREEGTYDEIYDTWFSE